jgi:V/A-type H+-transporting ATPase subunit E
MATEDIIRQITQDAEAEAETLLSNAKAEAEAIREKSRRQAKTQCALETEKGGLDAKEHARRIETLAGLELRKDRLAEKKNLIGEAFEKAEKRITALAPDDYRAFLRPIILDAVESGSEEIIPSAAHRDAFTPDFLAELNAALGTLGGNLSLSPENGEFSGGFILREGRKATNMTLATLISSCRDKLELKIAKTLFDTK